MIDIIAFDADDTLWHNEPLFRNTEDRLRDLLAGYLDRPLTDAELYATEKRNLKLFGYGVKGFTLSLIETAIELTEGRIQGREIQAILEMSKAMMRTPVQLLDHVADVIPRLAATYPLMLITKGDLFEQETKIARSGLAAHFRYTEILSEKDATTYRHTFAKYGIDVQRLLMVGNSLRSDVLPILALGGRAVHIPYAMTWIHEHVDLDGDGRPDYFELGHMGQLPDLVARLTDAGVSPSYDNPPKG